MGVSLVGRACHILPRACCVGVSVSHGLAGPSHHERVVVECRCPDASYGLARAAYPRRSRPTGAPATALAGRAAAMAWNMLRQEHMSSMCGWPVYRGTSPCNVHRQSVPCADEEDTLMCRMIHSLLLLTL